MEQKPCRLRYKLSTQEIKLLHNFSKPLHRDSYQNIRKFYSAYSLNMSAYLKCLCIIYNKIAANCAKPLLSHPFKVNFLTLYSHAEKLTITRKLSKTGTYHVTCLWIIFQVNFHHVEIPFIIGLWIFVSSLAKVGFHMTPKLHTIFPGMVNTDFLSENN